MSKYVLTDVANTTVLQYPFRPRRGLRSVYPNVSFPRDMSDAQLAEWNVFPVLSTTQPSFNSMTETIREDNPVQDVDGNWVQVYTVIPLDPSDQRERRVDALLAAVLAEAKADQTIKTFLNMDPASRRAFISSMNDINDVKLVCQVLAAGVHLLLLKYLADQVD